MIKKAEKGFLELHANDILKQYISLWSSYIKWLGYFKSFFSKIKPQSLLSIEESESFLRFSFRAGIGSLFFIYEIGNIFPAIAWRHIIKFKDGLSPIVLNKIASFFPAFSFSMDKLITLIYWGEQNPFLSVEALRSLDLKNFILKAKEPDSVEISTINLVWPKSARFIKDQELEHWAVLYLFNALLPPAFDAPDEIWSESPFVIVGDREILFITLHKTLCSIDKKSIRSIERKHVVNARATVIDRNIKLRNIPIDVPQEYIKDFTERRSPCESIFIKRVLLRRNPEFGNLKPYKRYTVYPLSSAKLFKEEGYGRLLTALSIVLRDSYLKSTGYFSLPLAPKELKDKMRLFFRNASGEELGLRLLENKEGLNKLISLLGVYYPEDSSFLYLHPILIECFNLLTEDSKDKLTKENLLLFLKNTLEYYKTTELPTPAQFKRFYENLSSVISFTGREVKLRLFLDGIRSFYIPLSKFLNSPVSIK